MPSQQLGKIDRNFLESHVFRKIGAPRKTLLVGPGSGIDTSAIQLGGRSVLVSTADPISYIPSLGPILSGWLSFHLLASDLATSGFLPQYGLFSFNLPPDLRNSDFAKYWTSLDLEAKRLGLSIIGGHTGRYPGGAFTVIGGGVMMAVGPIDEYLTSAMAHDGDELILTKGAAIEATAVLTRSFPQKVRRTLGTRLFEKAWKYAFKVSVVKDALTATAVGVKNRGVTAMHDATEGGVVSGIIEMSTASKLGAVVNLDEIEISEETAQLCKLFGIDPMFSLSEGSLILASKRFATDKIVSKLASKGISSQVIGKLSSKFKGCRGVTSEGTRILRYPSADPYWKAYSLGIGRKWK